MFKVLRGRLHYLKLLRHRSTWEWIRDKVDHIVIDHLEPLTRLRRAGGYVHPTVSFRVAENIEIGEKTRIQNHVVLWASPNSRIVIGDHSGLGPGTMVFSSNHQNEPGRPYSKQDWVEADVVIGESVWVGAGCVIVAGVTIGDGAVVAAGSVVTKDIPPGAVVAGVPARAIRPPREKHSAELPPVGS